MANDYQTIAVFEFSYQAQILKGRLEADGISVFLGDINAINAEPGASQAMGGVKVKVRSEDVIRAKRIKEEIDDRKELREPVHCPNCNSINVEFDATTPDTFGALLVNIKHFFKNIFLNESKLQYHCTNCDEKFVK